MGSHQLVTVDVRVIAATHIDLRKAISDGDFREDLYHRLNVIHLQLPSLAQRRSDIPALTEHFFSARSRRITDAGEAFKQKRHGDHDRR